jgi:hypothetical protein
MRLPPARQACRQPLPTVRAGTQNGKLHNETWQADDGESDLRRFHDLVPARRVHGFRAKFNEARTAYCHVAIGARLSTTSDIRNRVPVVVPAGRAVVSKNPQSTISRFGFGKRSCLNCRTR